MKVAEYRDLVRALQQIAIDWHACTSDAERRAWAARAARVYGELQDASCTRASSRDVEMRELAQQQYHDLVIHPLQQHALHPVPLSLASSRTQYRKPDAGVSRAAGYNKSPARAVRLARAARTAMRRGYF